MYQQSTPISSLKFEVSYITSLPEVNGFTSKFSNAGSERSEEQTWELKANSSGLNRKISAIELGHGGMYEWKVRSTFLF